VWTPSATNPFLPELMEHLKIILKDMLQKRIIAF